MIELLEGFPENAVAVDCKGRVTREDYEKTLIPAIETKLKAHDKLRLYYRIGEGFEGIDPSAVFEDMKIGLSHLMRWERMALVTEVAWIRGSVRAFAFVMPATVRIFDLAQDAEARAWIAE